MGKKTDVDTGDTATVIDQSTAGRGDAASTADHPAPASVDLEFTLLYSALCHDMHERAYARLHRASSAFNLVLGSAAAVAIAGEHPAWAQGMALAVAIIGAVQLVWDFGGLARDHSILRQRFYALQSDLTRGRAPAEVEADMIELFGQEPPTSDRTRSRAHDAAGRSLYGDDFVRSDGSNLARTKT